MRPISPVLAPEFADNEVVYAKDQPEYQPLPVIRNSDGIVLSRWTLTQEEREAIYHGADLMLSVHTFNNPLQPLMVEVLVCNRDVIDIARRMGLLLD